MYPSHPARLSGRLLAILASGTLALTLSAGGALGAPCADCEQPELPPNPGGPQDCGIVATVDPAITTASPRVGDRATATRGTWSGSPTAYYYQWFADGVRLDGATSLTSPVLPASAEGKTLVLRVTAAKTDCQSGVEHSTGKVVGEGAPLKATTSPVLSSAQPKAGEQMSVTTGTWSPAAGHVMYQWRLDGAPILGGWYSTYTPSGASVGKTVSVTVKATAPGHADGSVTLTSGQVAEGDAPVPTTPPGIHGEVAVGEEVRVQWGTWEPEVTNSYYQWQLDGVDIPGATSLYYTPTADTEGKRLRVQVRGQKGGYADGYAYSDSVVVGPVIPIEALTNPEVTGEPIYNRLLTVTPGTYSGDPTSITVQWRRNGVAIPGATGRSYRVALADIGRRVSVVVRASKPGTPPVGRGVVFGIATTAPARWTGPPLAVVGTPEVGRLLRSKYSEHTLRVRTHPDATRVTYRWYRTGKVIPNASSITYRIRKADRGHRLVLRVQLIRPGYQIVVLRAATARIR